MGAGFNRLIRVGGLLDDDDEKMSELEEGSDDPDAALV